MKNRISYKTLSFQKDFHDSVKFYDLLSGGFGSGKTYSLVMKTLKLANINRGMNGGILCPNLKMFKRDVLPTFVDIVDAARIPYKFNRQDFVIRLPSVGVNIMIFHSEDDGYSIKGPNLAWGTINEVNLVSKPAFEAFISRIRVKRAKLRQCAMSGTPEGFNWVYDFFIAKPREDADVFYGNLAENPHVAPEYIKMLYDSYDPVVAQQYIEGKFVNINALAALHQFKRDRHVTRVERVRSWPVWVSCDFNRNPMSATIYNLAPIDEPGPRLRGFDEIHIKGADTNDLAKAIKAKVGTNVVIFPDPAGAAHSTKSDVTDIEILESHGFTDIRFKRSIKSVRDCLNAANSFLNKGNLVLDPDNCRETIKDFEQTSMKQGTGELDKSDPNRTHWVDGFKNMIDYEFPIVAKAGGWRESQIR